MKKDNSKNCNQQNNGCEQVQQNNGCNHVQLGGVAFYDGSKCFLFTPDQQGVRDQVPGFRSQGVAQQLSDGTFDFVAKAKPRSQSKLIKKLAHGRVSKTKDNAVQLTLKVYSNEGVNIGKALVKEAREAANAVVELQLKQ